jgi:hypothetical protein
MHWPLIQIDAHGAPRMLGRIHARARDQFWLDAPIGSYPQLSDGLPFFLQDLIPQGFIGRTVPYRFPELGLPERVADWSDDHVLTYLCQRGEDCIGDLILGEESLQRFLGRPDSATAPIEVTERANEYPKLAEAAIAGSVSGSAAGGEHPKFTASIRHRDSIRHVLVKFSPAGVDPVARRWSDLLVCEHVATHVLQRAGLTSSSTQWLAANGRSFLEVTRFDRTGARGRSGLVSLAALSNEFLGRHDSWASACIGLANAGIISQTDAGKVRRIATFGRLIANTDMHFGNLSFRLSFEGGLSLAPVYDMLPMLYAPTAGGAVSAQEFEPPLPCSANLDVWHEMASLAESYWREVGARVEISGDFSALALRNAAKVARVRTLAMPVR